MTKPFIKVGIGVGHREICTPGNQKFEEFFQLFKRLPIEQVDVQYTKEGLEKLDALLFGAPIKPFTASEVEAIKEWTESGGRLLLLSSMGGDRAVQGFSYNKTNLGELVPEVLFTDTAMGQNVYVESHLQYGFDSKCKVDVSHRTPHAPRMTYVDGCTLQVRVDNVFDSDVESVLSFPGNSKLIRGLRRDYREHHHHTRPGSGHPLVIVRRGKGRVVCFGAVDTVSRKGLSAKGNPAFAVDLIFDWLDTLVDVELKRRMKNPQRHRLLQAYPMAPLMYAKDNNPQQVDVEEAFHQRSPAKRLLIGVLPHPYCNPMVKGCGFCTFPHEQYSKKSAVSVSQTVLKEIQQRIAAFPHLKESPVDSIYFGGATANLTSLEDFSNILMELYSNLQCQNAEVTLEGAPVYFLKGNGPQLLDLLANTVSRGRISMGVQTFDSVRLKQMGRQGYGSKEDIATVIASAHDLGLTTSCDMLIDLPNQTYDEILDDLNTANEAEFDQICVYHLVLFEGLETEWSKDPKLLAGLPTNTQAAERWARVCEWMNENGFVQTTITNFERRELFERNRNFIYEAYEMNLVNHDFIGFGPAGINRCSSDDMCSGYKLLTPSDSREYLQTMETCSNGLPVKSLFTYDARDMQVLYLTRHIGRSRIDFQLFQQYYGHDVRTAFPRIFPTLDACGFYEDSGRLTPIGNTYADSIAGLIAWPKIMEQEIVDRLKGYRPPNEDVYYNRSMRHHMG